MIRYFALRLFALAVRREAASRYATSRGPYQQAAQALVGEALDLIP
jgi:hypothetical protein